MCLAEIRDELYHETYSNSRLSKVVAHWDAYKMTRNVPGAIVECGIFKGASFLRFALYRQMCGDRTRKTLIGFDTFGKYPEAEYEPDIEPRAQFIRNCGEASSTTEIQGLLRSRDCLNNTILFQGDIRESVPEFVKRYPRTRIALLNMDVDLYEPAKVILETLYPVLSEQGMILLDDYNIFPGTRKAVDEFCTEKGIKIDQLPFFTLYYLTK